MVSYSARYCWPIEDSEVDRLNGLAFFVMRRRKVCAGN